MKFNNKIIGSSGKLVIVHSLKNQALIADKCYVADRFFDRLRGLIGRIRFEPGEGMLFPACNDIHTWFMRIPIDVLFLRKGEVLDGKVILTVASVRENVRPWRILPLRDGTATDTLELPANTVRNRAIGAGDEICISS